MAKVIARIDPALGPLTDDLLTPDVRVWQREKGHRFSSDDVATAYVAWRARPNAERLLDLGCGLGSVLLMLAWKMPSMRAVGIEAQSESYALACENVARNGFADRVTLHHGDLRDHALGQGYDLVTGTPPYFPPGSALDASDSQRTHARIELRGGIEAYVEAASRVLAPEGVVVLCGDSDAGERLLRATPLHVAARCDVHPRAGAPSLFSVWTLDRSDGETMVTRMTLRDADGRPSADAAALRAFSGF
jgi:tRNA1Val (adenine37-N6)-methyltransferase